MIRNICFITILLSLSLIFFGCTNKKNLVGTNDLENPEPIEIEIGSQYFSQFYSFEDSIRNNNSDNLVIGNYISNGSENRAVSLFKFTSLVDTLYEQIANPRLNLKIKSNHNFDVIDSNTLLVGKLKINWFESKATWFSPSDSTSWTNDFFSLNDGDDFELIDGLNIYYDDDDSLSVELPLNLLEEWIWQPENNFGLVFFTDDPDKFLEIFSSESIDVQPTLFFNYKATAEDSLTIVQKIVTHDVHIFSTDNIFTIFEDRLIISNIQPIRMLMKFDLPAELFTDAMSETIIDTSLFMQRLSINRADLILSFDDNLPSTYPFEEEKINIDPYVLLTDDFELSQNSPLLAVDDYEDPYLVSSAGSLNSDNFKINITSVVQTFVSGSKENFGIMLQSIRENNNLKHTEFKTDPKIKLIFTPPISD